MNQISVEQNRNIEADDEIDLAELLHALMAAKWLIAVVTSMVFLIGLGYAITAPPIYSSDVLLQVEEDSGGISGLDELTDMFGTQTPAETEIEIIRSRSVIGAMVKELRLDIEVQPLYFPLIGATIARKYSGEGPSEPWLGMPKYAWGGESIIVQRLDVPKSYEEVGLTLIAGKDGGFQLFGPDEELLAEGVVGKRASSSAELAARNGSVELFVAELIARPGTNFKLIKRPWVDTIDVVKEELIVAEKGKKTGIIQLRLEGKSPELIVELLDTVANIYLRQNVERVSAEAEKTLNFLNAQLPNLKAELDAAESQLNEYRTQLGSIDLPLETQTILGQLTEVEKQLSTLEMQRTELREKFTENHPAIVTLNQKKVRLEADRDELGNQIKSMPEDVQQAVRLTRDVEVAKELYLLLLNKAQEVKVVKAGTVGNVRIIDTASIPNKPIKPKKVLIVIGSLLIGIFLGVVVVFLRKMMQHGVQDPELLERKLGLPVYASIPHSEIQQKMAKELISKGKSDGLLANIGHDDLAMESIRSLRTGLQFAMMDATNNIISITGPSPSIGKSFTSSNLAYSLSEAGKRTLLIDADMRKGHLHSYFNLERNNGLSEILSGNISFGDAVHEVSANSFYFISSGMVPPNPSELLMSERLGELVKLVTDNFDVIVIDTPPLLAVSDAAIIGRLCSINFVLLRSGQHHIREVEQTIKRLNQNGIKPQGFILNDVPLHSGRYGYGAYGYSYQYTYKT